MIPIKQFCKDERSNGFPFLLSSCWLTNMEIISSTFQLSLLLLLVWSLAIIWFKEFPKLLIQPEDLEMILKMNAEIGDSLVMSSKLEIEPKMLNFSGTF